MFWCIDTEKKPNKHGGLDKIKIFSSQSDMDGGLDKTKIFSSQSDMVGWTKQRFSHHKVTWMVG
jgi:hypothetical protein